MLTIILSLALILSNYIMIMLAFKYLNKVGLFICIPLTIIMANLQVVMQVDFLGLSLTLGNAAYASSYLITDILGELYSDTDAKLGVKIGFFSMIFFIIIMNIAISLTPYDSPDALLMHESASMIFGFLPRIGIASIIAYYVSQMLDVRIFSKLKSKDGDSRLWLRNNISTVTSQLIDNLVFTTLAFSFALPFDIVVQIFVSTYVIKFFISIFDTPFMYYAKHMHKNNLLKEYHG